MGELHVAQEEYLWPDWGREVEQVAGVHPGADNSARLYYRVQHHDANHTAAAAGGAGN